MQLLNYEVWKTWLFGSPVSRFSARWFRPQALGLCINRAGGGSFGATYRVRQTLQEKPSSALQRLRSVPKLQQVSWFTYLPDLQSSKAIKDILKILKLPWIGTECSDSWTLGPGLLSQERTVGSRTHWSCCVICNAIQLLLLLMLCGTLSLGFSGPALFPMLWIAFLCASKNASWFVTSGAQNMAPIEGLWDSIAVWHPICSMYGIFTNICPLKNTQSCR